MYSEAVCAQLLYSSIAHTDSLFPRRNELGHVFSQHHPDGVRSLANWVCIQVRVWVDFLRQFACLLLFHLSIWSDTQPCMELFKLYFYIQL